MKWIEYPFVKISVFFVAGILLGNQVKFTGDSWYCLGVIGIIILVGYFFLSLYSAHINRSFLGLVSMCCFLSLGFFDSGISYRTNKPEISPDSISQITFYTAIIESKAEETSKTTKYKVTIDRAKIGEQWNWVQKNAILYFNDEINTNFNYGDQILIKGSPSFLEHQKNPFAFDYALFLQRKGIFLQDYISTADFVVVNQRRNSSILYWNLRVGDYFENILSRYFSSEQELNMARAMVIGRRAQISSEMEYVYQSTGTSHILAVSGLHVGIIYLVFSYMFKFLKGRNPRWLYYIIILCAIWFFAMITGFSPSVQRASTMLTFILAGEFLGRKSNIYNTILASAFFILLCSPNLIFSVSFQLSYVAVFGIVYLYKKIYTLTYIRNRFLNFFWKITAISISVQIVTFPITIHYFNQFPALFLLTNLLAIPTATIVIIGSLLLFVTAYLGAVPVIIGKFLEGWIYAYNTAIIAVSKLEITSIENLYLKPVYVFLLLIGIILLVEFFSSKRLRFFQLVTVLLFLLSALVLYDLYTRINQTEIVFYHVKDKLYYDIFLGRRCYTNIKPQSKAAEKEVYFNVSPYRRHKLISKIDAVEHIGITRFIGENTLIYFNNKSVLILKELQSLSKVGPKLAIDFLVIDEELSKVMPLTLEFIQYKNLILVGGIDAISYENILKGQAGGSNIHSIKNDGAYVIGG